MLKSTQLIGACLAAETVLCQSRNYDLASDLKVAKSQDQALFCCKSLSLQTQHTRDKHASNYGLSHALLARQYLPLYQLVLYNLQLTINSCTVTCLYNSWWAAEDSVCLSASSSLCCLGDCVAPKQQANCNCGDNNKFARALLLYLTLILGLAAGIAKTKCCRLQTVLKY